MIKIIPPKQNQQSTQPVIYRYQQLSFEFDPANDHGVVDDCEKLFGPEDRADVELQQLPVSADRQTAKGSSNGQMWQITAKGKDYLKNH